MFTNWQTLLPTNKVNYRTNKKIQWTLRYFKSLFTYSMSILYKILKIQRKTEVLSSKSL